MSQSSSHLLSQLEHVAEAVRRAFEPFCTIEVVEVSYKPRRERARLKSAMRSNSAHLIQIRDGAERDVAVLKIEHTLQTFLDLAQSVCVTPGEVDDGGHALLGADAICAAIDEFANEIGTSPKKLTTADRKLLISELKKKRLLEVRRSIVTIAEHLGVTRATIYSYAK